MTDKLWYRSSDQSLVRPTKEPCGMHVKYGKCIACRKIIASLPALTDIVIDPEYAKTLKDGWVKVERVRYEQECFDKWEKITKEDFYNTPYNRRLVILAPVEKGEEKHFPRPTLTDEQLVEKVQDWVSKLCISGGNAWTLRVPVDFNHDPDVLITELCRRLIEKPQAASGSDAVEKDKEIERLEARIRELEDIVQKFAANVPDIKDIQYGTSLEADFEAGTWTFLMDKNYQVSAGRFQIIKSKHI